MIQPITLKRCIRDLVHSLDNRTAPQYDSFVHILTQCKRYSNAIAEENKNQILLTLCGEIPEFTDVETNLFFSFNPNHSSGGGIISAGDHNPFTLSVMTAIELWEMYHEKQKNDTDHGRFSALQVKVFICKRTLIDILFELNKY